jgi:translation initiation factor 2-alpha kinase 4
MAAKKKPAKSSKQNGTESFPGLKSPGTPTSQTQYHELQKNEVMVLQAIYGDDFIEHSTAHSAWHVS